MLKIICRGAESIIYLDKHEDEKVLVKERIRKGYRIPQLDEGIRKQRTRREVNLMDKARRVGVDVPKVLAVEPHKIIMECIKGKRLKDILNELSKNKVIEICKLIGETVAKLHTVNIIHGDLTTSNMILTANKIYFIDFGLGKVSNKIEDQAVDLYLLYEAFRATHFEISSLAWQTILNTYTQKYLHAKVVLNRVEKIKLRRRYK